MKYGCLTYIIHTYSVIQRQLDEWRMAHNVRPVTSLYCKTPEKLFISGLYKNSENPTTGVADFLTQVNREEFGIQEGTS